MGLRGGRGPEGEGRGARPLIDPVQVYIARLRDIRNSGAGVDEISYYGALETLLNDVGQGLKPKVRCFMQLANRGAGNPDGGLFTRRQYEHARDAEPMQAHPPERGAIEVKGTGDDALKIGETEQVQRYVERYGLVLVTNLRDFVLVGKDDLGRVRQLESFQSARSEEAFWQAAQHPRKFAEARSEGLTEFLKRVMLTNAPLSEPKDVAWFLASYARTARLRLEYRKPDGTVDDGSAQVAEPTPTETKGMAALDRLRVELEDALGLKFEGEKGDHFFRSTLVQTLFYGVFAAWVVWSKERAVTAAGAAGRFEWELASRTLSVPMIRALFYQFADPARLRPLHINEVLDWAEDALNRVDRTVFFSKFQEEHAVQYFYEPFLEAFDPELRKQLGVWYTPEEVVKYMVARVDRVLREELDIADGLADENVYVLDPCCGTGAYLVEVLRRIDSTLREKGADALTRQRVKRAALTRVAGFEIMPAPFVVAHLQLGLLLQELGVPLQEDDEHHERAAIYLTNALTGWDVEVKEPKKGEEVAQRISMPELEEERDAACHVKRDAPILVILGNPPYNGFAGTAMAEEADLTSAYKATNRAPKPQGQGLNDLYVRFFRMAERRIVERTGRGIVCFISNYSWLDGLSFTGMRERYLEAFDGIWIDNLNGDKYKTGKTTPDGEPDPSIFSTEKSREGIQVGTAVSMLVRKADHREVDAVRYRDLWGVGKRQQLAEEAEAGAAEADYQELMPEIGVGLPFVPGRYDPDYLSWPTLPDLFPVSFPGVKTSRDDFVVDIDKERLVARMRRYLDPSVPDEEIRRTCPAAVTSTAGFDALAARRTLLERGFLEDRIVRYCYRPFDLRWLYWEPETGLLDRERAELMVEVGNGNIFMTSRQKGEREREGSPFYLTTHLADWHLTRPGSACFPLRRHDGGEGLFEDSGHDNLSLAGRKYLASVGEGGNPAGARLVLHHCLAIGHAPSYLDQNDLALRQDWPRVPLPADGDLVAASADLGRRVAALLDADTAVDGVTTGNVRADLAALGVVSRVGGGSLDPSAEDLAVTARWGIAGKGGITMPAQGRAEERPHTAEELAAIDAGAPDQGLTPDQARSLLGDTTFDIYLNDVAYWRNVPAGVWRYTLGGYQVIKKWLSYREKALLGRDLTEAEVYHVRDVVRRIAALLLLQPELDANYARVRTNHLDG